MCEKQHFYFKNIYLLLLFFAKKTCLSLTLKTFGPEYISDIRSAVNKRLCKLCNEDRVDEIQFVSVELLNTFVESFQKLY